MQSTGSILTITTLGVFPAINDTGNLRPPQGSGTHGTGLHGDVEGTVGQVLAAKGVGSGGDGLHLGMGSHVAERLRQVVGNATCRNYLIDAVYRMTESQFED